MIQKETEALDEVKNLDDTMSKLLGNLTPEVKQALNTLGVREYLMLLSECTKKRCQNKRLALISFVLGVHITTERHKLDALYGNSKICEER